MARFRGTVHGGRGERSATGPRSITTDANGWNLGVNVDGGTYGSTGGPHPNSLDCFSVYATGGSNESRRSHLIARVEQVPNEDGGIDRRITLFGVKGQVVEVYIA
jgi:hypothetical protein